MQIAIDKQTGTITVTGTILDPNLTLKMFEESNEFRLWDRQSALPDFPTTYKREFAGQNFNRIKVWVLFNKRLRLCQVTVSFLPQDVEQMKSGHTPNMLFEKWFGDEYQKRSSYREWLKKTLGSGPYNYGWGYITVGANQFEKTISLKIRYTNS